MKSALVAAYAPSSNTHNATSDAWADPVGIQVLGWAPSGMGQPVQVNRRPVIIDRQVFAAAVLGGPRARWTFPDGVFEQVGHAEDFGNGPWWPGAGVRINMTRVEG